MDLEGIIAISGFWLFLILLVFRGAIKERLIKAEGPLLPQANKGELAEMKARLLTLEARVTAMNHEILELQEGQDFDRRLLGNTEKASKPERGARAIPTAPAGTLPAIPSIRPVTSSPSSLRRPGLPPR